MESYYAVLDAMAAAPGDGVFAIIIDVEGSAYQKEGTWMWIEAWKDNWLIKRRLL